MLTARSWPVLTVSATGSLLISAPALTVAAGWPPNVTNLTEVMAAPLTRTPTDARPNRTARSPNVLDSRIRTEPRAAREEAGRDERGGRSQQPAGTAGRSINSSIRHRRYVPA